MARRPARPNTAGDSMRWRGNRDAGEDSGTTAGSDDTAEDSGDGSSSEDATTDDAAGDDGSGEATDGDEPNIYVDPRGGIFAEFQAGFDAVTTRSPNSTATASLTTPLRTVSTPTRHRSRRDLDRAHQSRLRTPSTSALVFQSAT